MAPTPTDEKLAGMIGDLTDNFAKFQIEYATQRTEIKGDIRELGAQIKGDIRELRAQVEGRIEKLDTKFEIEFRSLEKRVDRGFGFQKWLAGFLIPITLGLIGTAVSLAFSAGHLDSSVRQLSTRMDKLEQALEKISSASRQLSPSPPILPSAANPSERIFELRLTESMIDEISRAMDPRNPRIVGFANDGDIFQFSEELDAGKKPEWLTNGMAGLVLFDRFLVDGSMTNFSSKVNYKDDELTKNKIHYLIYFHIKHSELGAFKDKILSIDPAGKLHFSICFVRP